MALITKYDAWCPFPMMWPRQRVVQAALPGAEGSRAVQGVAEGSQAHPQFPSNHLPLLFGLCRLPPAVWSGCSANYFALKHPAAPCGRSANWSPMHGTL